MTVGEGQAVHVPCGRTGEVLDPRRARPSTSRCAFRRSHPPSCTGPSDAAGARCAEEGAGRHPTAPRALQPRRHVPHPCTRLRQGAGAPRARGADRRLRGRGDHRARAGCSLRQHREAAQRERGGVRGNRERDGLMGVGAVGDGRVVPLVRPRPRPRRSVRVQHDARVPASPRAGARRRGDRGRRAARRAHRPRGPRCRVGRPRAPRARDPHADPRRHGHRCGRDRHLGAAERRDLRARRRADGWPDGRRRRSDRMRRRVRAGAEVPARAAWHGPALRTARAGRSARAPDACIRHRDRRAHRSVRARLGAASVRAVRETRSRCVSGSVSPCVTRSRSGST